MFTSKKALPLALLGMLLCLTCLRCWVFVAYSRAHFDSDQAVIGLMAKDLASGRALAFFTYGRTYMLAVSAWLCAPLFAWFGASVTLLKLPLVAMNLGIVAMLWVGLRREGAPPSSVALSILPFAVPSVVVSSRLVEQGGGNIEPFVFLLVGFLLRAHPLWLGLNFGVACLNREFALIGLVALLLMDGVQGKLRERCKAHALTGFVIVVVVIAGRWIARHYGANYFGQSAMAGRPGIANVVGVLTQQLPVMIGGKATALQQFNITSTLTSGHRWLCFLVAPWVLLVAALGSRLRRSELDGMSTYLMLVGGGQVAAYMLLSPAPNDPMLMRYTLLVLLGMVGLVAHAMRRPALRAASVALVSILTLTQLRDHAALIHEYATRLPPDDRQVLADELLKRGVHYAVAGYWLAYHVSFLTDERVIVTSDGDQRIRRYRDAIAEHAGEVTTVSSEPCVGAERVASWYLCKAAPQPTH
jgi:hypothetical protein